MRNFRDLSIKTKLIVMQLLTTFVVLMFFGIYVVYDEWKEYQNSAVNQLTSAAQLLSLNSISSLHFLDVFAAEKVLSSLETQTEVVNAWIFNSEGILFAKYSKNGYKDYSFPEPAQEQIQFAEGYITISKEIIDDEECLGILSLRLDAAERWNSLLRNIYIIILALIAGMIAAFFLAAMVQKKISSPILKLADKLEQVTKTGDYSIRIAEESSDQIGHLSSGFNRMLKQIQSREAELDSARDQLQTVLDAVPGTISWIDSDLNYLGVNRKLARRLTEISKMKGSEFVGEQIGFQGSSTEFVDFVKALFSSDKKHVFKETSCVRNGKNLTHLIIGQKYAHNKAAVFIAIDITQVKEAEKALNESEKRFSLVLEASNTGIWDYDILKDKVYYSPRWKALIGYKDNELENISDEWENRLHPDDKEQIFKKMDDYIAHPEGHLITEYRLRHKDGSYRWILNRSAALVDEDGKPYRMLGSHLDITERKLAEKEVQLNEYRIKTRLKLHEMVWATEKEIMDYSLEEMLNIAESKIGYIAFMNEEETVLTMYSWTAGVMEGCKVAGNPIVYPVETTGLWGEAVRQRKAVITNDYSAPNPFKKGIPNGHVKVVRHMNVPVFDGDSIVMVAGVGNKEEPYTDSDANHLTMMMSDAWQLVQKRRAEEALRGSERRLKESQQIARIGQWELDLVNNQLYWSEGIYHLFEMDPDKFGTSYEAFLNAIHPDDRDFVNEAYTTSLKNKIPYDIIHRLLLKDGTIKYVNEICRTEYDKDGNAIRSIGTVQDITELKQVEEELKKHREHLEELVKERTKELETFSYSVSHDLRAPLRAIDGFSEILSDDYKDKLDDEAKRLINVIRKNTRDMNQLITDLLDFSRLGRQQVKTVKINIKNLARDVFEELRQLYPKRDIKFKLEEIPSATGDINLIRLVFTNLISNAIKFSRHKKVPEIEIGFKEKDGHAFYYVKDNGVGFEMKYVDKIFEVFQRLHISEEFEGTGVGLAIVQKIIYKHGGKVTAEGKVNKGATFYFSLPKNI